jgi:predicted transposase YbfD/YdcC
MNETLLGHFSVLPDPRKAGHGKIKYSLTDIVAIIILAMICGADTWNDIEEFGIEKEEWLKKYLTLENGIPSHDTLARVFSILDPNAFQKCFLSWIKSIRKITKNEVVAIDGKAVRRSHNKNSKPPYIVSAFATANGVTLGQVQVDEKSNEITAIPELLDKLFLKGCIVTIDAMGCQKWIARKIVENKGDYVLAVKRNQKRLLSDITKTFEDDTRNECSYSRTSEKSHGRNEVRECWTTTDLSKVRDTVLWKDLTSIACITDTRTIDKKTSTSTRYFILNRNGESSETLKAVRAHWAIENTLHWSLDVVFKEDESRVRIGHAQKNLTLVRKLALTLLRNEKSTKVGLKAKRLKAGWNSDYLLKILGV